LANGLAHSEEIQLSQRLVIAGLITAFVFTGIPLIVGRWGRVDWSSGFGLRKTSVAALASAGLLGLALWPLAHEIYVASVDFGIATLGSEQMDKAKSLLNELQGLPLPLVLMTLAIVPGVFEELCFRGFLFASFRSMIAGWQTIVITSALFGLFHEVLGPGRFLPSVFLGLVLGWVRLRTNSVLPCMLLHILHNGLLLSVMHWREALDYGVVAVRSHLPATWLMAAVVGVFVAGAMLVASTRAQAASVGGIPSPRSSIGM
jgi:ABC-2 type transport system permease protein/sodium transport system permease protein